ncbi:hypothetical protein [uncultured Succinatimonas sp.]|uniref:hypothetical protein n=1 Tax=uncultured Succinatimonas sp. TaxID=1262973 RepID=UPI0025EBDEE4|nr:hypothetical protein [uncultured Succinatimonas sp.]
MIDSLASRIMLNNQTAIPAFGLGVFKVDTIMTAQNVEDAISAGYRRSGLVSFNARSCLG